MTRVGIRWLLLGPALLLTATCGRAEQPAPRPEPKLELVIQTGHTQRVTNAAFSEDGRLILTGSSDGTALLWDANSGQKLRAFVGHRSRYLGNRTFVGLSSNGSRALTCGDQTAIIWDTKTGEKLHTLDPHSDISAASLSSDGNRAVTAAFSVGAVLWDARTGIKVRTFAHPDIFVADLSADGTRIVTGSSDKTAILWDAISGEKLQTLAKHTGYISGASLTSNGSRVLTYSSLDETMILWDGKSGAVIRTFKSGKFYNVKISGDGEQILTSIKDGVTTIWNANNGKKLRTLPHAKGEVLFAGLSRDGRRVLTGLMNKADAVLWDTSTGERLQTLTGRIRPVTGVAFGTDDSEIITWSESGPAIRWNIKSGKLLQSIATSSGSGPNGDPSGIRRLSNDGLRLLRSSEYSTSLWDTQTGKKLRGFPGHRLYISNTTTLSGDGTRVVTADDKGATLWDANTGAKIRTLMGHAAPVCSVGLSEDGSRVLTGADDDTVILWNANNGEKLQTLKTSGSINEVRFAKDGSRILATTLYGAEVWDAKSGKKISQTFVDNFGRCANLSNDGKLLLVGSRNGVATIWDIKSNAELRSFKGHNSSVTSISLSNDGQRIATSSTDGTTRVWNASTGMELCCLVNFDSSDDWLVITNNGQFDGSINAPKYLSYRIAGTLEFVPLERFQQKFYQPGVLGAIVKGVHPQPVVNIRSSLPPVVRFTLPIKSGVELKASALEVQVEAESRSGSPILALRLLVDGRPYKGQFGVRKMTEANAKAAASWSVELEPGKHTLKVLADTEYVQGASDEIEVKYIGGGFDPGKIEIPKLYVLAIGISSYPGVRKLDYAAKDANAIAATFLKQGRGLYQDVEVKVITDEKATQDEIFAGLLWLREKMTGKATGIVFFGGHAEVDKADNSLYLLPVNFQEKNLAGTAIDAERFKKQLMAIPGRLILMLDACHAGAIGGDGKKRGPGELTDLLVRDLTAEENGLIVMCSALGHEQSQESNEFRHGLFTWAVLEALREGKADKLEGAVYLSSLDSYVAKRVKELSKGRQNPVTGKPTSIRDFPLVKS